MTTELAGCLKDAFYMYQSEWTDTPVLHIFPHWNRTPRTDSGCVGNKDDVEIMWEEVKTAGDPAATAAFQVR
jgi:beta-galactosidase